jgi:hypothetical protein
MNEATVKKLIRRGIREPKAQKVDNDDLEQSIADAISLIGQRLLAAEPDYFKTRVSLSSNTNIFTLPTALDRLLSVWDMADNALTVSGAADNGSGLVRITTSAVHGFATGDIVTIHGILGTTEANGTFQVTKITTTTFDLVGSTYANAWTSGGKCFEEDASYDRIVRMAASEANGSNTDKWYLDGSTIIVDDPDFTYDIIINYRYVPSSTIATALTEIPAKFHYGIVAYCVLDLILMVIPPMDDKNYANYKSSQKRHEGLWTAAWDMISDFKISKESKSLSDVTRIKRRI